MSAIQVLLMYMSIVNFAGKSRLLFGRSPLFGVSIKREFTVVLIKGWNIYV